MRTLFIPAFFFILIDEIQSQCCTRFDGRKCIECPNGTHLFRANCILDVKYCATYKDGFDCATCLSGYTLNLSGQCEKIIQNTSTTNVSTETNTNSGSPLQIVIDFNKIDGPYMEYYYIADDFLRSAKMDLQGAKTSLAKFRKYQNGSAIITIQYLATNNIGYRGLISLQIEDFTMKQISFTKINNTKPTVTVLKTETLNINTNAVHKQLYLIVEDLLDASQSTTISTVKSASIKTFSDNSYSLTLSYVSKVGSQIQASVTISANRTAKVTDSKITKEAPVNTPSENLNMYISFTPNDADDFYLICKDFLWGQPDFKGVEPTSTKKYSSGSITNYLLRASKLDGSIWDIFISFDTNNFIIKIEKTVLITATSLKPSLINGYTKIDTSQAYRDFNFILVLDYIIKQSNSRYLETPIKLVQKMQNSGLVTFRITYNLNGNTEVYASINTLTFVTSGFSEPAKAKEQQPATINTVTNSTNVSNTTNNPNNIININTNNIPTDDVVNKTKPDQTIIKEVIKEQVKLPTEEKEKKAMAENKPDNKADRLDKNGQINQQMNELSAGMTPYPKSEYSTAQFRDVDNMLRSVNQAQLKNSVVIGVFFKNSSYNKNFQIFYMQQSGFMDIWVASITRNMLTKRNYIISFGKMGH